MIKVNLLPKDFRKSARSLSLGKSGIYVFAGAAAVVLGFIAITFWQMQQLGRLESDIERANQRAEMLRDDIRVVDGLTDVKNKITKRIEAVERLDRHRTAWVRILEDVSRNVPEFVWLDEFKEVSLETPAKDRNKSRAKTEAKEVVEEAPAEPVEQPSVRPVKVRGYAFTLNALAATMIRMMRSDYFDKVELVESYDTLYNDAKAYSFQLSANVHYLSEEELRTLVGEAEEADSTEAGHASLD